MSLAPTQFCGAQRQARQDSPSVQLPTWESPSFSQTVVGRSSQVSSDLEEFRGIPYGSVSQRWEQSHIRNRLPRDIFDATHNGPKCVQPSEPNDSRTYQAYLPFPDDAESELDCLNLSVIRPSPAALQRHGIAPYARLPVLVWIHGGALAFGAGTDPMWNPSGLVFRSLKNGTPIIAVTINYRLNIFGFAASSDILATQNQDPTSTSGLNFGIRDQKVALAWVARNISAFGGDPERITIGGQSAGAVSTHTHLREATCNARSALRQQPLFRRALLHSGSLGTLGPLSLESREASWKELYEALFGPGSFSQAASPQERVSRMRQVPAASILQAAKSIHKDIFHVVSDGITANELPNPLNAAQDLAVDMGPIDLTNRRASPTQKGIDVLLGVTDLEASIFLPRDYSLAEIQALFEASCHEDVLRASLLQSYGLTESATEKELQHGLLQLMSDAMFEVPVSITRRALRAQQQTSVIGQVQAFHVKTGNPFPGPSAGVAHHCVELVYLFGAFEADLAGADKGIAQPYTEPGQGVDTSFLGKEDDIEYKQTNIELSHSMQDTWIDFIVADDWKVPGGPDSVLVYGKDRSIALESTTEGPAWQTRRQRWELLGQDPETMFKLCEAIRGG